jgi:hypothetical protein
MLTQEGIKYDNIAAVAFTDSVHCHAGPFKFMEQVKRVMSEYAINWRASDQLLDYGTR